MDASRQPRLPAFVSAARPRPRAAARGDGAISSGSAPLGQRLVPGLLERGEVDVLESLLVGLLLQVVGEREEPLLVLLVDAQRLALLLGRRAQVLQVLVGDRAPLLVALGILTMLLQEVAERPRERVVLQD